MMTSLDVNTKETVWEDVPDRFEGVPDMSLPYVELPGQRHWNDGDSLVFRQIAVSSPEIHEPGPWQAEQKEVSGLIARHVFEMDSVMPADYT